jgi:EAL domain-containing protein (putative c-di-GMP-specific phosphodiesterase class I)
MNKLAEMGCDYVQGYYIAKAMPQHEFLQWLESYEPYQIGSA